MLKKWVYLFDEVDEVEKEIGGKWDDVRAAWAARAPTWRI